MSEKIHKVLARMGFGSRREIEGLIASGRVQVDGRPAVVGDRIEGGVQVSIDGKVVLRPEDPLLPETHVLMYHKPDGELTTYQDPENRPTVFDHLPPPPSGRWIYIGRLDLNTSGLLLFTTNGELANALTHPSNGIERTYAARVYGEMTGEHIRRLKEGVRLEDGMGHFDEVTYQGGEGRNQWYHVTIREGRKREVRRLFEAVGLRVSRLIRISFAGLPLDERLRMGECRELTQDEIRMLMEKAEASLQHEPKMPRRVNSEPRRATAAKGPWGGAGGRRGHDHGSRDRHAAGRREGFGGGRREGFGEERRGGFGGGERREGFGGDRRGGFGGERRGGFGGNRREDFGGGRREG
ncbi:MAG: pseudouridine synthase, partial [Succinivibrionaceae bacterium]|nr:pseudouridine synthase [Succinivibrionaceae bacterium]